MQLEIAKADVLIPLQADNNPFISTVEQTRRAAPAVDPTQFYTIAAESRYWEGPVEDAPRLVSPSTIDRRVKKYRRAAFAMLAGFIDLCAGMAALGLVSNLLVSLGFAALPATVILLDPAIGLAMSIFLGAYKLAPLFDARSSISLVGKAWLGTLLAMPAAITFFPSIGHLSPVSLAAILVALLPALLLARVLSKFVGKFLLGTQPYVEIVIDDGWPPKLPNHQLVFNARRNGIGPDPTDLGSVSRLSELLRNVDLVTVYAHASRRAAWARTLRAFDVRVDMRAPELEELGPLGFEYRQNGWQMVVARHPLGLWQAALKRGLDLAVVLAAMPFLALPMAVVALMVRLDSPGPVLFRQQRVGRGNRVFNIYKFRSMRIEQQDNSGVVSASRDDNRITRVGGWLRRTSIDELPQLLNVLRGEMSLVGPRPHAIASRAEGKLFWEIDEQYWMRHAIKPGLAQVSGYRGATDHQDDVLNRVRSDLEYAQSWSLWSDIKIIIRTLGVMRHENAY
jgi:polysaccharide biosynthesis protein PslA